MRNIDIYCAYTQWGKTNLFVNKIVNYSEDDFMIIMPNLLLARDDMHSKITKSMKQADRTNYKVYLSNDYSNNAEDLSKKIINNRLLGIQNIYIIMGNTQQLRSKAIFTAIHAAHNNTVFTNLIIDESDQYLTSHSVMGQKVDRDLELDRIIEGAPIFKNIEFYTATIYTHALWVFSDEDTRNKYNIKWHLMKRGDNYYHFDSIYINTKNNLDECFINRKYTDYFEPIKEVLDSLSSKNDSLYIHTTIKVNGQDKLREEILNNYPDKAIITANMDKVWAYYRNHKKQFTSLNLAADWCLDMAPSKSIIWIGGQSLERMMTLTDSNAKLLLNNMILFGRKSHVTGLIQTIGRMTGRYNRENWIRKLYAPDSVISNIRASIAVEKHFYDILANRETITIEDFKNMPEHKNIDLTMRKALVNTVKSSHSKLPVSIYAKLEDAILDFGKRHIMPLQNLFSPEQGELEIKKDKRLKTGTRHIGYGALNKLIDNPPCENIFNSYTIFVTDKDKYIDNRNCSILLQKAYENDTIHYVTTYNSEGNILVWDISDMDSGATSYSRKNLK